MRDRILPNELARYVADGYVLLDDFLSAPELNHWRDVVEEAVGSVTARAREANWDGPRSFCNWNRLASDHPALAALVRSPRVGKLTSALAGVSHLRVWQDMILYKMPWDGCSSWHLDAPYFSFSSPRALSLWVPLDDVDLANGCLWFMPGTHRTADFDKFTFGPRLDSLFDAYPEWRGRDAVPMPCPAGSAVFINGLVAHAAGPNMTLRPRRTVICSYMPDGSVFNGKRGVFPDEYYHALRAGDALTDDRYHPLVWPPSSNAHPEPFDE